MTATAGAPTAVSELTYEQARRAGRALLALAEGRPMRSVRSISGLPDDVIVALSAAATAGMPISRPLAAPTATSARQLAIGALFVDRTYQRDLNQRWVRARVETFDPQLLGVLEVSDRGPVSRPRYAIIDGQHRWALARSAAGDDGTLLCHIHTGLAAADEAMIYRDIDAGRRRLNGWERWKARLAAGEPVAVAIREVVEQHGYRLQPGRSPGTVTSVKVCEDLVAGGGLGFLGRTLTALTNGNGHRYSIDPYLLGGAGQLLSHYTLDELAADDALYRVLKALPPDALKVRVRQLADRGHPGPMARLTAATLIDAINERRGPRTRLAALETRVLSRAA